jgi:hypothetical protein
MWQLVGHESGRHARHQRLAASAQAAEPSRAVHRGPVPLTFSPLGLPGVHAHTHPQRRRQPPGLLAYDPLDRSSRGHGIERTLKHRERGVALALETNHAATGSGDLLDHESVMAHHCRSHRVRVALPQPDRPDHIGQHERAGMPALRRIAGKIPEAQSRGPRTENSNVPPR